MKHRSPEVGGRVHGPCPPPGSPGHASLEALYVHRLNCVIWKRGGVVILVRRCRRRGDIVSALVPCHDCPCDRAESGEPASGIPQGGCGIAGSWVHCLARWKLMAVLKILKK